LRTKRDTLRAVAEQNAEIAKLGMFEAPDGSLLDISNEIEAARQRTRLISAPFDHGRVSSSIRTRVSFASETTIAALHRLHAAGHKKIAVLNFASATSPGGGYLRGGSAQEETLCRATLLYDVLRLQSGFYEQNKALADAVYRDVLILSGSVPVIRDNWDQLIFSPFVCDILSCPAPNRTALMAKGADKGALTRADAAVASRIRLILDVAASLEPDVTILGAWGCGVFGNDPIDVARLFRAGLHAQQRLPNVHFAIPDLHSSQSGAAFVGTIEEGE